ncbi:DUF771 domain-containing protein, partial [Pseudomonas sp. MOB-449]|nr:DUF771 domain-containing protein [Pseudomonas sp. MOB-449]
LITLLIEKRTFFILFIYTNSTSFYWEISRLSTKGKIEMPHILNVTVPIPETHVLITKDEYDELIGYSLDPVWNMSDLKEKLNIASDETIKARFLFHPRFEKELRAQGIVHYPDENFNRWRFNARKMNKFVDEHFNEIYKERIK